MYGHRTSANNKALSVLCIEGYQSKPKPNVQQQTLQKHARAHTHSESTMAGHATVVTAIMARLMKASRATLDPIVIPVLDDNTTAAHALLEAGVVEQGDLEDRGLSFISII